MASTLSVLCHCSLLCRQSDGRDVETWLFHDSCVPTSRHVTGSLSAVGMWMLNHL